MQVTLPLAHVTRLALPLPCNSLILLRWPLMYHQLLGLQTMLFKASPFGTGVAPNDVLLPLRGYKFFILPK